MVPGITRYFWFLTVLSSFPRVVYRCPLPVCGRIGPIIPFGRLSITASGACLQLSVISLLCTESCGGDLELAYKVIDQPVDAFQDAFTHCVAKTA